LLEALWLALAAAWLLTEGAESDSAIYKQYRD
jgi:hypothetical protein